MGDRSSASLSLPRSNSKEQIPTLLWKKKLSCEDVHTSNLTVPAGVFLGKRRRERVDGRTMVVAFMDHKGGVWEMQTSYKGLSWNWDKFVKEHGLRPEDEISFYNDESISEYYVIKYKRSG